MWDLSLPGYKYLGPGNKLDKGLPTNYNDWVAYFHDIGYGRIIEQGGNPYLMWSDADAEAYRAFSNEDYGGFLGKQFFGLKKLAHDFGLISKFEEKNAMVRWFNEEHEFARMQQRNEKASGDKRAREVELDSFGNPKRQNTAPGGAGSPTVEEVDLRTLGERRGFDVPGIDTKPRAGDVIAGERTTSDFAPKGSNPRPGYKGPSVSPAGPKTPDTVGGDTPKSDVAMEESGMASTGTDGDVVMSLGADAGTQTDGQATGAEETPVDFNMRRELGIFTETRTAILPLTYHFSVNQLKLHTATPFKIRLNVPYNVLTGNTFVEQTEGATRLNGLSFDGAPPSGTTASTMVAYDTTLIGSTAATATTSGAGTVSAKGCIPAWLLWYEKIYESYHVIACDYRVTIRNASTSVDDQVVIFWEFDSYTTSSTGNVIPLDGNKQDYRNWKDIKQTTIAPFRGSNSERYSTQIQGRWKPGMLKHNTTNNTDIKVWYPTGAEPGSPNPIWVEQLVVLPFMKGSTSAASNLDITVEQRWTVQFKDLKLGFRYPKPADTDVNLVVPDDIMQTPNVPITTSWED